MRPDGLAGKGSSPAAKETVAAPGAGEGLSCCWVTGAGLIAGTFTARMVPGGGAGLVPTMPGAGLGLLMVTGPLPGGDAALGLLPAAEPFPASRAMGAGLGLLPASGASAKGAWLGATGLEPGASGVAWAAPGTDGMTGGGVVAVGSTLTQLPFEVSYLTAFRGAAGRAGGRVVTMLRHCQCSRPCQRRCAGLSI